MGGVGGGDGGADRISYMSLFSHNDFMLCVMRGYDRQGKYVTYKLLKKYSQNGLIQQENWSRLKATGMRGRIQKLFAKNCQKGIF